MDWKAGLLVALFGAIATGTQASEGYFIPDGGYPVYGSDPVPCRSGMAQDAVCFVLLEPFTYVKQYGDEERAFQAASGLITDGASIPKWAQGIIGRPHDKAFSRASVIHDHYVLPDNAVLNYFLTQRVFRDILLDSGVDKGIANKMYLAVLAFAPKYSLYYRSPPEDCENVPDDLVCIRNDTTLPDGVVNYMDALFDDERAVPLLNSVSGEHDLENMPDEIIEALAMRMRVDLGVQTPPVAVFGDDR